MYTLLPESTTQPMSRWLKIGLCSLAIGASSLFLATGSALALTISDYDELWGGPYIAHPTVSDLATAGDFYIHDHNGNNSLNGNDDWHFGEFDLSGTDWTGFEITEAKVTFTFIPTGGIQTDEVLLGSVFDYTNYLLTDEVLLPDIFIDGNSPLNYGITTPTVGVETTIVELDLLAFPGIFSAQDFMDLLQGGDSEGKIWWKFADDAFVSHARLDVTAFKEIVDTNNGPPDNGNTVTPEPASLVLLGTGLVSLAAWRYRKEKTA